MFNYYMAYGSNLNLKQMKILCPLSKLIGTFYLTDYKLMFKGNNDVGYLTIEKSINSRIPVAIFRINKLEEKKLDKFEVFPTLYHKEYFMFDNMKCMAYVMNDNYEYLLPKESYYNTVLEGYNNQGFHPYYLNKGYADTEHLIYEKRLQK